MNRKHRHTHQVIVTLLILIYALAMSGCGMHNRLEKELDPATAQSVSEKQLSLYSTSSLLSAADSLYESPSGKDRACLIYRILAIRYKDVPDDAMTSVHANMKLWNRYLFDFQDISQAMEYLNAAADICETKNINTAEVDYGYAISYQCMGNHTREPELYRKALEFYENAFSKIKDTGETELYDRLIPNYLTLLYSFNEPMKRGAPYLDMYARLSSGKSSDSERSYNMELNKGLTDLQNRQFTQAASHFRMMRNHVKPEQRKQLYMSILNEATALQQAGLVRDAIRVLDQADSVSSTAEDNEILVSLYFTKYKYWELLGDTANSHRFYILYCQTRDSLLSYNQITGLRKAELSQSMTRMGHRLSDLEYRGKIQTVAIVASTIITLLLIVFILIIRNKNRVLRQSNQSLYEQNKAVLAAEKREREERHRFAELVEKMRQDVAGSAKSVEKAEKYSSRKLTGDTKNEIHETVLNTMENCPEIFSSDFSLARLSEICGSRQEYVSQVINETFGCNFNELINKYRIREACRRIDDKVNYGQFTLAAIASGVGIDSPTTFSKYFRKVTGLTPSQYKKSSDAEYVK